MKRVWFFSIFVFVLLASCAKQIPPISVTEAILPTATLVSTGTLVPTMTLTPNPTTQYQETLSANQTQNAGYSLTQVVKQTEIAQTQVVKALTPSATPTVTITPTPTVFVTPTPNPVTGLIVTLGEERNGPWHEGDLAFSPDGTLIAMTGEKVRIWNVYTHELMYVFNETENHCMSNQISFSPDGIFLAISSYNCWSYEGDILTWNSGHLRIWDLRQKALIQDWPLEMARMYEPYHSDYEESVGAFAFLPDNKMIAMATGNTIQIRNISEPSDTVTLELGDKMYASEISISEDGRFLFVLMDWKKWNTFPALYMDEFGIQIWNLQTYSLSEEFDYQEIEPVSEDMSLHNEWVSRVIFAEATFEMTNLVTGEVKSFPYRLGERFLSSDRNFALFVRLNGIDLGDDDQIELWQTDTWRNLYTFLPNFAPDWQFSQLDFEFSPDNKILAISHQEQLSLWNIEPVTYP